MRYGTQASEGKPAEKLDPTPLIYAADGSVFYLFEEAQEPWNAHAAKKRRESAQQAEAGHRRSSTQSTWGDCLESSVMVPLLSVLRRCRGQQAGSRSSTCSR